MQAVTAKDSHELSVKFADWLVEYVDEVLSKSDRFTMALSGGNTPKKLYQLLVTPAYIQRIDWSRIHFFWGDERFVPFEDERSNAKMAFDELLSKVPVQQSQIHIMQTGHVSPEESAAAYEKILRGYFGDNGPSFDLVILGLGNDAHTLSLFPGYDIVTEHEKWVGSIFLKEQDMYRITLTPVIVNRSAKVVFLVSGGDKAAAIYHVISSEHDPNLYPAQAIQPFSGQLLWFYDEAAAADL